MIAGSFSILNALHFFQIENGKFVLSKIEGSKIFTFAGVAEWQTRRIQNPVWLTPGEGSSPSSGIVVLFPRSSGTD